MSASLLSQNSALSGLLDKYLTSLAEEEQLAPQTIVDALEAGTMVLLGNPVHPVLKRILVGQPARI